MLPEAMDMEQSGSLVTVYVRQTELTHTDLQTAVDECSERMRYSNAMNFIFDLEGVEFLASACLGVLVTFLQDVEHCRGRIALANCGDNVALLFKVTRLDTVFLMCEDAKVAAASF